MRHHQSNSDMRTPTRPLLHGRRQNNRYATPDVLFLGVNPCEPQTKCVSSACVHALRNAARTSQSCDTMALTSDDRPTGAFVSIRLIRGNAFNSPVVILNLDEAFPFDSDGTTLVCPIVTTRKRGETILDCPMLARALMPEPIGCSLGNRE